MKLLWAWGGTFFGYREGNSLWTHHGKHVGQFHNDEVYGIDGQYLGEIQSENRLITCVSKKSYSIGRFTPYASRVGIVPYVNYVGYIMYVGYEDFPSPDHLI